jgi:rhombotail lipoprotein
LKGHNLTELRGTAARYGVDWLLIVDGAAAVDRYNNYKAGLLYWTIAGAYVADGTHSDALCVLKATLWDVKTGAALFEEEAEAQTNTVGPAALVDDDREIERARTTAMHLLMERLTKRFAMLVKPGK